MTRSFCQRAFSLTELMVTVAVIGILSSIVIQITGNEWRRERVQAVQVDLVGWLEAVRRAALRGASCEIQIQAGSKDPGSTLATVVDNGCLYTLPMTIPGIVSNGTIYTITTNQTNLAFTPRGTVRTPADANLDAGAMIEIRLNGGGPVGCVSIGPSVGAIRTGLLNAGVACRAEDLF